MSSKSFWRNDIKTIGWLNKLCEFLMSTLRKAAEQSYTIDLLVEGAFVYEDVYLCIWRTTIRLGYLNYGQMLMRTRKICHMSQLLMKPLFAAMIYVRTRGKVALCKRSHYKNVHIYEFIIDIPLPIGYL